MYFKDYVQLQDIARYTASGKNDSMLMYNFVELCEKYGRLKVCIYYGELLTYYRHKLNKKGDVKNENI